MHYGARPWEQVSGTAHGRPACGSLAIVVPRLAMPLASCACRGKDERRACSIKSADSLTRAKGERVTDGNRASHRRMASPRYQCPWRARLRAFRTTRAVRTIGRARSRTSPCCHDTGARGRAKPSARVSTRLSATGPDLPRDAVALDRACPGLRDRLNCPMRALTPPRISHQAMYLTHERT